jgi:DNA-binding IclR family transcriptional regulator
LGSIPWRNHARKNRSGIRREAHDLRAGRLARILLLLAHFGKESRSETVHPGINQEHLAQMVGATRSRVSHFMNNFRSLGFIDYEGNGGLTVNNGLLSVILSE